MNIKEILKTIAQNSNISDLHLTVALPPMIRYNGNLMPLQGNWNKMDQKTIQSVAQTLMGREKYEEFLQERELDFSYSYPGVARFRVNAYHQRDSIALALRVIPADVRSLDEMGLPPVLKTLCRVKTGFILCTGPTGSGKSTTLAAMVDQVNQERTGHILTLEDPIEYLHRNKKSVVHQREIGGDSTSFSRALRAALRQDPDVILVGEMRDLETISTAIEAAETGHLVMATLHTNDAPQAVDRIIDVFPPHQQNQIRTQLAAVLAGVVAHQLIPRQDEKGRILALEIMVANSAVRNLIREGKTHQLYSVMQTGGQQGMQTMDSSLLRLYEQGIIEYQEAAERSRNPEYLKKRRRS